MNGILEYIGQLPAGIVYLIAAFVAAFENIFPPFPSDVVVAFSSFAAARGGGSFWIAATAVTIGSTVGAMLMYWVGRVFGSTYVMSKLERYAGSDAISRFESLQKKYGLLAIFLSRFLPGVRSVVPPLAGATRIKVLPTLIAMVCASAIWYSAIAYIAFKAGNNWESILDQISEISQGVGLVAIVIVAILLMLIWRKRRRRKNRKNAGEEDA